MFTDSEIPGRRVRTRVERRRLHKRAERYPYVPLALLGELLRKGEASCTARVIILILWHTSVAKGDRWVTLRKGVLTDWGLGSSSQMSKTLTRLERRGVIEVERSRGRRTRMRLIGRTVPQGDGDDDS
jgi:hypothetical protein